MSGLDYNLNTGPRVNQQWFENIAIPLCARSSAHTAIGRVSKRGLWASGLMPTTHRQPPYGASCSFGERDPSAYPGVRNRVHEVLCLERKVALEY